MLLKEYQAIDKLDSTSKNYFSEVANILNLDLTCTPQEVQEELDLRLASKVVKIDNKIYFNHKVYRIEKELPKVSYWQFVLLEQYLDDDAVQNLHRILALFCRPEKRNWFRKKVEPFNMDTHEALANDFLKLDMNVANSLILFFWDLANHSLRNTRIQFLNKMKTGNQ